MDSVQPAPQSIRHLKAGGMDIELQEFELVGSTFNLSAVYKKELITEKCSVAFRANAQSAGQGQRNNSWASPVGNVYVTWLRKVTLSQLSLLSSIVGLAVYKTVQPYIDPKYKLSLKWINDVFVQDKKISGVLIRSDIEENEVYAQIGVGVNWLNAPMASFGCIKEFAAGSLPKVEEITVSLLQNIEVLLAQHSKQGFQAIRKAIEERIGMLGQHVYILSIDLKDVLHEGVFVGIDEQCNAILRQVSGDTITVTTGRMRKEKP